MPRDRRGHSSDVIPSRNFPSATLNAAIVMSFCLLQQRDLGSRFDHPASGGHRVGDYVFKRRRSFADSVIQEVSDALFHTDASR